MFAKCLYCKKRFTLKFKKDIFGRKKASNQVIVSFQNTEHSYVHKTCYERYKRNVAKKFKLSGGLNAGIADIHGEIE